VRLGTLLFALPRSSSRWPSSSPGSLPRGAFLVPVVLVAL
jgi:hypothetical protein